MTRYKVSYTLAPDLLRRAMISWDAPQRSHAHKRRNFVLVTLFYVVLFGGVIVVMQYDILRIDILMAVIAGFAGGMALWAVIHWISSRKLMETSSDAIARQGLLHAEFDAEQVVFTPDISFGRMGWRCFDAVVAVKDATVLKAGGLVYAIPDVALPDGTTPENFTADLTRWMEDAR